MLKRVYIACALLLVCAAPAVHAASLDPSFGTDGRVIVDLGGTRTATAGDIAVQPDGKLVVSGWIDGGFGVVRLLPDGRLDPAFGIGGAAVPVFGEQDRTGAAPPRLALQPDRGIVVAGPAFSMPPVPNPKPDFGVMRLTPAGALDPSFGQGGKAVFQVGPNADLAQDVAIQPDGKIVVAGYSAQTDGQNTDFSAIRLTPAGRLDTSFGSGGAAIMPTIPDSGFESLSSLALLPDGRILLAGVSARPATAFDVTVMRMTATGQPDLTFGDQGRTVFPLGAG